MTIPYPNTQPMPAIAAVTPPSGAARPRLTFLGTGYLGATYAICFAELGYEVLGFDVDADKIAKLNAGEVPIHEPGLDELLRRNLAAGRLRFSTDIAETADFGDVHFICVGTPQRADGMGADLSLRRGVGHQPRPAPDPQGADRRQVHRAGRHRRVGGAARRQAHRRPTSASRWPGARSSSRRASPSTTCCAPTGSSSGSMQLIPPTARAMGGARSLQSGRERGRRGPLPARAARHLSPRAPGCRRLQRRTGRDRGRHVPQNGQTEIYVDRVMHALAAERHVRCFPPSPREAGRRGEAMKSATRQ